ncbi:MAG TPA: hypothetical protein VGI24_02575 [Solirubrobacteraceae bacterium]|jgi:hypothetical protein
MKRIVLTAAVLALAIPATATAESAQQMHTNQVNACHRVLRGNVVATNPVNQARRNEVACWTPAGWHGYSEWVLYGDHPVLGRPVGRRLFG